MTEESESVIRRYAQGPGRAGGAGAAGIALRQSNCHCIVCKSKAHRPVTILLLTLARGSVGSQRDTSPIPAPRAAPHKPHISAVRRYRYIIIAPRQVPINNDIYAHAPVIFPHLHLLSSRLTDEISRDASRYPRIPFTTTTRSTPLDNRYKNILQSSIYS